MMVAVIDSILGEKVEYFGSLTDDIHIYEANDNDRTSTLFFIQGSVILKKLVIEADCGQNIGYIDILELQGVE